MVKIIWHSVTLNSGNQEHNAVASKRQTKALNLVIVSISNRKYCSVEVRQPGIAIKQAARFEGSCRPIAGCTYRK